MKQKLYLFIIMFCCLNIVTTGQNFSGGNGTQFNPYRIFSKADLDTLAHYVNTGNNWSTGKYFRQIQDITDTFRTCIGVFDSIEKYFQGNYNGAGHLITLGINVNDDITSAGLFGAAYNAVLDSIVTIGYVNGGTRVAGIVGTATSNKSIIIKHCINAANISGNTVVGGIIGDGFDLYQGVITNCLNIGKITAVTGRVGGIIGDDLTDKTIDSISFCINAGPITSTQYQDMIGGIVGGDYRTNLSVNRCLNIGNINNSYGNFIGSIAGINISGYNISLKNNFYDKQMSSIGGYNNNDVFGQTEGGLTNNFNITGNILSSKLGSNYIYEECMYPRLGNHPAYLVAASPIFLNISNDGTNFDTYNNINHCFTLANKYDVNWESVNKRVSINGTIVTLNSIGNDTLICSIGNFKKYIPIYINSINNNLSVINTECFADISFNLATQTDTNKGKTTGNGMYKKNTKVEISAISNDCYYFVHWTDIKGNILPFKQIDTINIISDSNIVAVFEQDSFFINTSQNIIEAGSVSNNEKIACNDFAVIKATNNDCYYFVHWTDIKGNILPFKQIDTINIISDSNIVAVFEQDSFFINTSQNIIEAGSVSNNEKIACNDFAVIKATNNDCYQFICWIDANSKDTISKKQTDSILIKNNKELIAIFKDIHNNFKIKINEHKNILPTLKNYEIPIYINSDKELSNITIESLKLKINKNVFSPTSVSSGTMSINKDTIEIKNINILHLNKKIDTLLCTIAGVPILGNTEQTSIEILEIQFPLETCNKTDFINGEMSIEICNEGGNRLINTRISENIKLDNNFVNNVLEVKCNCSEKGNYSLEIVDILGNTKIIQEWKNNNFAEIYNFELETNDLQNGNYFIIFVTPNTKYYAKFGVVK